MSNEIKPRKVLVCLVSDQTIPNVEFIKEFQNEIDSYLFITTEYMESPSKDRTKYILEGASLSNIKPQTIIVKEDSLDDISTKLSDLDDKDEYIVNLTGGTKMMSIAVYNYFQKKKSRIYYKPIRTNKIISVNDCTTYKEIKTKISVNHYLKSYGVESNSKQSFEERRITNTLYEKYLNGSLNFGIVEKLRVKYRNKRKRYTISDIENDLDEERRISGLADFLDDLGFLDKKKEDAIITKDEIAFLTGGWFEELCYWYFKEELELNDDAIQLGVQLKKSTYVLDNDLDVVFVYNNNLYVIECKTAMALKGKVSTALFNETIYKASALRAKFGLSVKNLLLTLSSMEHPQIDYTDRASVMNISLYGRKYFNDGIKLDELLSKIKTGY